jgi:hypothetical protein
MGFGKWVKPSKDRKAKQGNTIPRFESLINYQPLGDYDDFASSK